MYDARIHDGAYSSLRNKISLSSKFFVICLALVDFFTFMVASITARVANSGWVTVTSDDVAIGALAAVIFVWVGRTRDLYRLGSLLSPLNRFTQLLFSISASLLFVTLLFFCLKTGTEHSRFDLALFFAIAGPSICVERAFAGRLLSRGLDAGWISGKPAILIGERLELLAISSSELIHFGIGDLARFEIVGGAEGLSSRDRRVVLDAIELGRSKSAAEFSLLMSWSSQKAIDEVLAMLQELPVSVRLYPDDAARRMWLKHRGGSVDFHSSVEVHREPLRRHERFAKRGFDIASAAFALVFLAPILVTAAILIKVDSPGPIIFKQRRRGFDQNTFVIFKFRTMTVLEDGAEIRQATKGDQRVTRVGRLLRRSSIDELPQLWNVLLGDMSLVGPRPHALAHDAEYSGKIAEYARRHHVKPGLTGAAQVEGFRGETRTLTQMAKRVEWDLWYINNWSFGLDLWIMLRTVRSLIKHGAF